MYVFLGSDGEKNRMLEDTWKPYKRNGQFSIGKVLLPYLPSSEKAYWVEVVVMVGDACYIFQTGRFRVISHVTKLSPLEKSLNSNPLRVLLQ